MDVFLKDYLHLGDAALAVSEALRDCTEGDILHLGGGLLELTAEYAHSTTYYLPRYSQLKKRYAIYAEKKRGITIDGDGASLIAVGDVSAFGFDECDGIALKNFSIDCRYPYFWQAEITEADDTHFDVRFDPEAFPCEWDAGRRVLRFGQKDAVYEDSAMLANEYDFSGRRPDAHTPDYFLCTDKPHEFYPGMSVETDVIPLGRDGFRFVFRGRSVKHTPGKWLVIASHERRNNNVQFHRCRNIVMENIDMYASISFGVIALMCENMTVRNVNSIIKPGSERLLAVAADMFHCVNCRGLIDIGHCRIESGKDDAINIHSLFSVVDRAINGHTLLLKFTYLARQALNLYRSGSRLCFIHPENGEKHGLVTVRRCEMAGDYHLRLELEKELDQDETGMLIEAMDDMPKVYIHDCHIGGSRGRGILVTTPKQAVIERCVFYTQGPAISVNGWSPTYLEGSNVTDMTIRDNYFDNSAYRGGPVISVQPRGMTCYEGKGYHSGIKIWNNCFRMNGRRLFSLSWCDGVSIRNNVYREDVSLERGADYGKTGLKQEFCRFVEADELR